MMKKKQRALQSPILNTHSTFSLLSPLETSDDISTSTSLPIFLAGRPTLAPILYMYLSGKNPRWYPKFVPLSLGLCQTRAPTTPIGILGAQSYPRGIILQIQLKRISDFLVQDTSTAAAARYPRPRRRSSPPTGTAAAESADRPTTTSRCRPRKRCHRRRWRRRE